MSVDDLLLVQTLHSARAVDYFLELLSLLQYFQCWRATRLPAVRQPFAQQFPLTLTRRLENVVWRKWFKDKNQLGELCPHAINWYKENDITCIYGPVFSAREEPQLKRCMSSELVRSELMESECLVFSLGPAEETFTPSSLPSPYDSVGPFKAPRSILKGRVLLRRLSSPESRNILFNYVVSKREIINLQHYDYAYLDYDML